MYVSVKGGERAIDNAHRWLAEERRGDADVPELTLEQIAQQLSASVDRVMTEGSLFDRELAALAIKQARGDLIEAVFLLRAYRSTLPRFGASEPLDTAKMAIRRRISATFKDVPGGQILGPTFDYTHRLLDFTLAAGGEVPPAMLADEPVAPSMPRVADLLGDDELIEPEVADDSQPVGDLTRDPFRFPHWRVATRVFCWRWATPASAATGATTPSRARSGWAKSLWSSCRKSWVSPSRSASSPSPNARWSTSSTARPSARRNSRVATVWCSATASARP
jgi:alpha-D-ribose 1-methylphosphonate 5-triphosphate synthase subunit PhnI